MVELLIAPTLFIISKFQSSARKPNLGFIQGDDSMKYKSHIANGLLSISLGALMSTVIILEVGSVALQSETGSAAGLVSMFRTNSSEYSQFGLSIQQSHSLRSEGC